MSVSSSQSPRLMEALVDFSRISTVNGLGVTDDPLMAHDFARQIYNKSFYLETACTLCETEPNKETDGTDFLDSPMTTVHGQAGYIRNDDSEVTNEDESVASFCVTAKHNLSIHSQAQPDGTLMWALPDSVHKVHHSSTKWYKVQFSSLDFRCVKDKADNFGFGIDATVSPLSVQRPYFSTYELVRESFKYQKGVKIGITVFRTFDVTPDKAGAGVTQAQFDAAFGEGLFKKAIYTGEIKDDSGPYFSHNVNTYQGCSGAIVFLLQGQDNPSDDDKAIAVHSCATLAGKNYAFKLQRSMFPTNLRP